MFHDADGTLLPASASALAGKTFEGGDGVLTAVRSEVVPEPVPADTGGDEKTQTTSIIEIATLVVAIAALIVALLALISVRRKEI